MINKLLKSKYKLHHLVNVIYYGVCFIAGYLVGVGYDKVFNIIREIVRS